MILVAPTIAMTPAVPAATLQELFPNMAAYWDATRSASHGGTGQTVANIAPAQGGVPAGGYDLVRGPTAATEAGDASFNGTAGVAGSFLGFDGTQSLVLAGANPAFLADLHKGGSDFTVILGVATQGITGSVSWLATAASSSANSYGIAVRMTGSKLELVHAHNGGAAGYGSVLSTVNVTAPREIFAVGRRASDGLVRLWLRAGAAEEKTLAFPSADGASSPLTLGGKANNGDGRVGNGSELYFAALVPALLTNAEMGEVRRIMLPRLATVLPAAAGDARAVQAGQSDAFDPTANDVAGTFPITAVVLGTAPARGSASVAGTTLTYTPGGTAAGAASVGYKPVDAKGNAAAVEGTIAYTIASAAVAPQAADASYAATGGSTPTTAGPTASLNLLASATAGSAALDPASIQVSAVAAHGTVTVNADGTAGYAAAADWSGADAFAWSIADVNGLRSNAATATVTTTALAPIAAADAAPLTVGQAGTISVLANDTARTHALAPATVRITSAPANGSAAANADGTLSWTAASAGNPTLAYDVADTRGNRSDAATVTASATAPAPAYATLADVHPSAMVEYDTTRTASHGAAASQEWRNLLPATADGTAPSAFDLYLGNNASVDTYDPTFVGAFGAPDARFESDGSAHFVLKSTTNPAFISRLHRTDTPQPWTMAAAFFVPASLSAAFNLFGTVATGGTNHGLLLSVTTDGTVRHFQRNASAASTALSTARVTFGAWNWLLVARDPAAAVTRVWVNGGAEESLAQTYGASSTAATQRFSVGNSGGITANLAMPNGTALALFALFDQALVATDVAKVRDYLNAKHGRVYA